MDSTREADFVSRLDAYCGRERTLIVATHRMSLLSLVDKVLVLDGGKLALAGTRDKVMEELQKMQARAKPVGALT
jgi:ATP-binding cassette subfamily C protein LapB